MMPSDLQSDLHWLAFRYAAGELSPDESSAFEARLAEDQEAREAVAAAVELAAAVIAARPALPETLPFVAPRRHPWRWVATVAAAACVALVVWASRPPGTTEPERDAAPDVALNWSGLREDPDSAAVTTGEVLAWLDEAAAQTDVESALADGALEARDSVPLWLVEAAALREGRPGSGSDVKEN
jgi:hypothetical protein